MTDSNDVNSATIEKEELKEVDPEDSNLVAGVADSNAEEPSSTLPMVTEVHLEGTSVYVETDEDTITEIGDIVTVAEEGLRTRITDTIGSDFIGDVSRYEASLLQNWREDKQAFDLTTVSDGEHEHLAIDCGSLGYVIIEENVDELSEVSVVDNYIHENLAEDDYEWKQDTEKARNLAYLLVADTVFLEEVGDLVEHSSNAGLETSIDELLTAFYDGDVRVEKIDNIIAYTARMTNTESNLLKIAMIPLYCYQILIANIFEPIYKLVAESTTNIYLIYPFMVFIHFVKSLGFILNILLYIGYKLSDKKRLVEVNLEK